jgi:predicted AlkP superfamily phosphohydrolase/phosphomutase
MIGLDAAEPSLIKKWKKRLPNLTKLIKEGTSGLLHSTIPPVSCPAWNSMVTGKEPSNLGLFDFVKNDFGKGTSRTVDSTLYGPTVWEMLSHEGIRVGVVNAPFTFPLPKSLNGFLISGFLTPNDVNYTYPEQLSQEIQEAVGNYQIHANITSPIHMRGGEKEFLQEVQRVFDKRQKLTLHLLKQKQWNFFFVVFMVLDWVQHYFWGYMDSEFKCDPRIRLKFKDVILEWYIKVDTAIGELVSVLKEDVTILVASDHGFGPMYGRFFINRWLAKNGYLTLRYSSKNIRNILTRFLLHPKITGFAARLGVFRGLGINQRVGSRSLISRLLPRSLRIMDPYSRSLSDLEIDWARTKAYGFGYGNSIYLNIKNREAKGIVNKGEESEKITEEICFKIGKIRKSKDGKPLQFDCKTAREIYKGTFMNEAPSIVYTINNGEFEQANLIVGDGIWQEPYAQKTGNHRQQGFWCISGPGIKRDYQTNVEIIDLTPTILALFDTPLYDFIDGRIISEAFVNEEQVKRIQILPGSRYSGTDRRNGDVLDKDERRQIKERLRSLGYLD